MRTVNNWSFNINGQSSILSHPIGNGLKTILPSTFKHILPPLIGLVALPLLLTSCTITPDQREFENEAYSIPSNYTPTNIHGEVTDQGEFDPDDWRIGPMFSGIVELEEYAHPNPSPPNSVVRITLYFNDSSRISGLTVLGFSNDPNDRAFIQSEPGSEINDGLFTLRLNSNTFYQEGVGGSPLYRVLIYDQNNNLITYGDVKVEE